MWWAAYWAALDALGDGLPAQAPAFDAVDFPPDHVDVQGRRIRFMASDIGVRAEALADAFVKRNCTAQEWRAFCNERTRPKRSPAQHRQAAGWNRKPRRMTKLQREGIIA